MRQIFLQPTCNEPSHDDSEKLVRQINIWATSGATFESRHNGILSISSGVSRGGPLFSYKERDSTRRQDQRSPAVTRERCRPVDLANGERPTESKHYRRELKAALLRIPSETLKSIARIDSRTWRELKFRRRRRDAAPCRAPPFTLSPAAADFSVARRH